MEIFVLSSISFGTCSVSSSNSTIIAARNSSRFRCRCRRRAVAAVRDASNFVCSVLASIVRAASVARTAAFFTASVAARAVVTHESAFARAYMHKKIARKDGLT